MTDQPPYLHTVTCGYCRESFTRYRTRSKADASRAAYDALLKHSNTVHADLIEAARKRVGIA